MKPLERVYKPLKIFRYAWELYDYWADPDWYKLPDEFEGYEPAPGYTCYSYYAPYDNGDCESIWIGSPSVGSSNCSTWHYRNQTLNFNPAIRGRAWGPRQGLIYGCERYNLAHVASYPQSVPPEQRNPIPKYKLGQARPLQRMRWTPLPDPLVKAVPIPQGPPLRPRDPPPYIEPAFEVDDKGPRPSSHVRLRPHRNEKEKKRLPKGPWNIPGNFLHNLTEFNDFVDAIYDALPDRYKTPGRKTPQQKLLDIWNGLDHVDWGGAFGNYLYNHFEDAIVGALNRRHDERLGDLLQRVRGRYGPRVRPLTGGWGF